MRLLTSSLDQLERFIVQTTSTDGRQLLNVK